MGTPSNKHPILIYLLPLVIGFLSALFMLALTAFILCRFGIGFRKTGSGKSDIDWTFEPLLALGALVGLAVGAAVGKRIYWQRTRDSENSSDEPKRNS